MQAIRLGISLQRQDELIRNASRKEGQGDKLDQLMEMVKKLEAK